MSKLADKNFSKLLFLVLVSLSNSIHLMRTIHEENKKKTLLKDFFNAQFINIHERPFENAEQLKGRFPDKDIENWCYDLAKCFYGFKLEYELPNGTSNDSQHRHPNVLAIKVQINYKTSVNGQVQREYLDVPIYFLSGSNVPKSAIEAFECPGLSELSEQELPEGEMNNYVNNFLQKSNSFSEISASLKCKDAELCSLVKRMQELESCLKTLRTNPDCLEIERFNGEVRVLKEMLQGDLSDQLLDIESKLAEKLEFVRLKSKKCIEYKELIKFTRELLDLEKRKIDLALSLEEQKIIVKSLLEQKKKELSKNEERALRDKFIAKYMLRDVGYIMGIRDGMQEHQIKKEKIRFSESISNFLNTDEKVAPSVQCSFNLAKKLVNDKEKNYKHDSEQGMINFLFRKDFRFDGDLSSEEEKEMYEEVLFLGKNKEKLAKLKNQSVIFDEVIIHVVSKLDTCFDCKIFYLIHTLKKNVFKFLSDKNIPTKAVVYSCYEYGNSRNTENPQQDSMVRIKEFKHLEKK